MNSLYTYDVFISYSRKDMEYADKICNAFDRVGITYFIDRKGIRGGADYLEKIASEIDNSRMLLFLASSNSYKSRFVPIEIHYAFNHDKKIIPYAIDNAYVPHKIEILLVSTNWLYIDSHPITPTLITDVAESLGKKIVWVDSVEKNENSQLVQQEKELEEKAQQAAKELARKNAEAEAARKEVEKKARREAAIKQRKERQQKAIDFCEIIKTKTIAYFRTHKKIAITCLSVTCVAIIAVCFVSRHLVEQECKRAIEEQKEAFHHLVEQERERAVEELKEAVASLPNRSFRIDSFHYIKDTVNIGVKLRGSSLKTKTRETIKSQPETINIPDSIIYQDFNYPVTSIGDSAFYGCKSLTSITIPNSVTSIGNSAFYGCNSLTSITIPNSVTSIGDNAFYGCKSFTSIAIPNSVTSIGEGAFKDCRALYEIVVDAKNTIYDSRNNCSAIIETSTNKLIAGCKNTIIPESVTSIGNNAFDGCESLTSITIPNSVTSIGDNAFYWCKSLTSITIPNSVTSIGNSAFDGCKSLTSITIPNSVTSIGYDAFRGCNSLSLRFKGTKQQWQKIYKYKNWNALDYSGHELIKIVQCTDGNIEL